MTGSVQENQENQTEGSILALYLIQSAVVHFDTLLLQGILSEEKRPKQLADTNQRALSPLFWTHANLCGRCELDMNCHLALPATAAARVPGFRPAPGVPTVQLAGGEAGTA
nr:transposase [Streptomyces sp. SID8354]